MACFGLHASLIHPENGMTSLDMHAAANVATMLDEVIIFRSTGPWSRRWIEAHHPTKNFHVKGKSSDWGPQAGFVPHEGTYSKVGADLTEATKGTNANNKGITEGYAKTTQLILTKQQLLMQLQKPEESPPRTAVQAMTPVQNSEDFILIAARSGDRKDFAFRAVKIGPDQYRIDVYSDALGTNFYKLIDKQGSPLLVMGSGEEGAGSKPMTGDYDLMAVCPKWADYGNHAAAEISKPGIVFVGERGAQPGQTFPRGAPLDKVLDMRTNTGARPAGGNLKATFQGLTPAKKFEEHGDMGNVTPRILRCVNALNAAMGDAGPLRRVHHNAESHRNHIFGALTGDAMGQGDGLPLTVFQPGRLLGPGFSTSRYQSVCTLETLMEFKIYAGLLHDAGYYVPRNWTWGMSIRDAGR